MVAEIQNDLRKDAATRIRTLSLLCLMWVIVTMAVLKEVFHKKCIRIGTKWVSVSNGGAGREDPDADFLKFKKVYSKRKNRRA